MKNIIFRFVGDGTAIIPDAPSEDITQEAWDALPKHVQRSIAASELYERVAGESRQEPGKEPEPAAKPLAEPDEPQAEPVEADEADEADEQAGRGFPRRKK